MATARKLPSGKWRVRIYIKGHDPEYVSFTSEGTERRDKTEIENKATEYKLVWERNHGKKLPVDLTVGVAMDRYIESKSSVLSPGTVREYKLERRNYLQSIMGVKLADLTQEAIQRSVNEDAMERSPKTVRNAHGLLSATLDVFMPDFRLRTTLPPKRKYKVKIPDDSMIREMLGKADPYLRVAMIVAAFGGLRRAEICALERTDILGGNVISIDKAIVLGDQGEWIWKDPKTYDSCRTVRVPEFVIAALVGLPSTDDRFFPMYPDSITSRFWALKKKLDFDFRFHDLRHYNASLMLALGIPDKYAMERMGHATTNMLKTVYQHTMDETKKAVDDQLIGKMVELYDTKYDTKC